MNSPEVMTIQQVADFLQLHYQTVYEMITSTKEIPASKVRGRWRIQKKDLLDYLERRKDSERG